MLEFLLFVLFFKVFILQIIWISNTTPLNDSKILRRLIINATFSVILARFIIPVYFEFIVVYVISQFRHTIMILELIFIYNLF